MTGIITMAMPILRHGLTTVAGALISKGVLEQGMTDQFVGVGLGLVGLILSFYNAAKAKKA